MGVIARVMGSAMLRWVLAWLALPLSAAAAEGCSKLVVTGNPEYPPYLWRDPVDDNRLVGANADFMLLLGKEIGVPVEMRYVGNWARVQEVVRSGRADMIAGAFYTLPRLEYMDYFYPAFRETRSVIWVQASKPIKYRKWADLQGLQGVTVINNSFGEAFDRYAKEHLRVDTVSSLENALKVLQAGRVDYLLYEEDPGLAYAAKLEINDLRVVSPALSNENLHLTISHKSACNTGELRGRIARALHLLGKQGVMNKLIEANIQLWRRQAGK
ncbi:transporter substrate-binding domain-containing protein [uncultured Rhodoferax sp.]|uniref:substrate-binding periplasmic protein n=1 Tax=uncultured Rhodoferax sp. TaxID=223188 RepID=UPI0025FD7193|nr:transporter substrate-binding domain-containing protein [uncultured Rhodoferax sp.]